MIVTLIAKERIYTMSLPRKVSGRYWMSDQDEAGRVRQIADIEGVQNRWTIRESSVLGLLDDQQQETHAIELGSGMKVINAYYRKDRSRVQLLIEPPTKDRQTYKKYCVSGSCRLNIGRAEDNQIVFNNKYVSGHHACLIWDRGVWSVVDTQSSNGTFVNERRIATAQLCPGDTVYIMGLKIVVGNGFLAMNNPDGCMSVRTSSLAELAMQVPLKAENGYAEDPEQVRFFRSPRISRNIVRGDLRVDSPPQQEKMEETPLGLLLGPAITMGITGVVMGAVAVINYTSGRSDMLATLPTLVMSLSMLCGTMLWPQLTRRHEKKKKMQVETERRQKYLEYLDRVKNEIYRMSDEQKAIWLENCPSAAECERRILQLDRNLWERTVGQSDFLRLRLGMGKVPLEADIRFPEKRFSVVDDAVQNELNRLADMPKVLNDAPVSLSLRSTRVTGIVGGEQETTAFLNSLVVQLAALHCYDELKLIFLVDEAKLSDWSYARLLPHSWDDAGDVRFLATNSEEARTLALTLERVIQERSEQRHGQTEEPKPYYVVIAADVDLAKNAGIFSKIQSAPGNAGFACVTVAPRLMDLPNECSVVIELDGQQASLYDRSDSAGEKTVFRAEGTEPMDMERAAGVLANIVVDNESVSTPLPSLVTFLEMYDVGKTEHLNALTRWNDNSPVNTLQVPVGVAQDGSRFHLDLHEKAHGPHGLIAGMTGSGKSEFIITFVLSLAVNYHPDEVSFILIDYKGGGLAGAFEDAALGIKLPHLAGTITNLDGNAVNRALISIQSELRRRQAIFNEARQVAGGGTVDIYKYQKMYRSGLVSEPVPHLFIVADEFAELKAQQPEFMTQLVSAARIGRSLGVHLILATQKPSGVVDDQIWSNSRFRVCLKVQERADSMEMLKRADAAELKDTGRFYLQVGFNELFELGQSAWCGAPYVPADRVERKRNDSIEVIDHLGRILIEAKPKAAENKEDRPSQIVSIVQYLSNLAAGEKVASKQLWLPQIPEKIYLDELKKKYGWTADTFALAPIIGEYDDPANQSQGLLTVPFSEQGNTLVYGITGGGKTTLLNTMLVGLLSEYDAERLNVYILDMGEETLRVFADAPQVGDVMLSSDTEKVTNLFKMLQKEIAERKKLFASGGGSYEEYCRSTGETLPQILVIIRNYASFAEQFEMLDEQLIQITRDCNKYGIYFLLTANAASSVRYRVAQNFANVYALQLNDNSDYVSLFGGTNGVYPSKIKGRGIFKAEQAYEFQTAHFSENAGQQALRAFVKELAQKSEARAKPVPVLPDLITANYFANGYSLDSVPVGIEKISLQPSVVDFSHSVISVLLAQDIGELENVAQGIVELLSGLENTVTVLDGANILHESANMQYGYLGGNFSGRIDALFEEMVRRNNTYKTALAEKRPTEEYHPEYIVITGLQTIMENLSAEGKDRFTTLMEKAELAYNIRFLICENAKTMSRYTVEAWYKRHLTGRDGIWVGDGITDQSVLSTGKITNDLYSEVPPNFGYVVKQGRPVLVKFIVGEHREEAER